MGLRRGVVSGLGVGCRGRGNSPESACSVVAASQRHYIVQGLCVLWTIRGVVGSQRRCDRTLGTRVRGGATKHV